MSYVRRVKEERRLADKFARSTSSSSSSSSAAAAKVEQKADEVSRTYALASRC